MTYQTFSFPTVDQTNSPSPALILVSEEVFDDPLWETGTSTSSDDRMDESDEDEPYEGSLSWIGWYDRPEDASHIALSLSATSSESYVVVGGYSFSSFLHGTLVCTEIRRFVESFQEKDRRFYETLMESEPCKLFVEASGDEIVSNDTKKKLVDSILSLMEDLLSIRFGVYGCHFSYVLMEGSSHDSNSVDDGAEGFWIRIVVNDYHLPRASDLRDIYESDLFDCLLEEHGLRDYVYTGYSEGVKTYVLLPDCYDDYKEGRIRIVDGSPYESALIQNVARDSTELVSRD